LHGTEQRRGDRGEWEWVCRNAVRAPCRPVLGASKTDRGGETAEIAVSV